MIAVRAEGLGKRYRIGELGVRYRTLRESIGNVARAAVGRIRREKSATKEHIWALRNASFEIGSGEVVGIIGRNGAGKTTLLKVLSRITQPTEGYADIFGRVGSLLEVGSGFNLELTGRENVFLNGAILGMRKREIDQKFDEIVAFAEVEKFIDTPVKRYSTGMYMRLAFSVAAHLEPEILLVDEVLAVGDAAFQKKCIGKMSNVAHEGRTVLFVSHNMAAVRALCSRGILVDRGELQFDGPIEQAIFKFSSLLASPERGAESLGHDIEFSELTINGSPMGSVNSGDGLEIEATMHVRKEFPSFGLRCIIENSDRELIAQCPIESREWTETPVPGTYRLRVSLASLPLKPGVYSVYIKALVSTLKAGKARYLSDNLILDVTGDFAPPVLRGLLAPRFAWDVSSAEEIETGRVTDG